MYCFYNDVCFCLFFESVYTIPGKRFALIYIIKVIFGRKLDLVDVIFLLFLVIGKNNK